MHFITKATPIGYSDSKCHIKKLKGSIDCSDLNFNRLGANTYRDTQTNKQARISRLGQKSSKVNIIPHTYMHKMFTYLRI